jgi:hypothetical protein
LRQNKAGFTAQLEYMGIVTDFQHRLEMLVDGQAFTNMVRSNQNNGFFHLPLNPSII